jgi:signal transduction histidine kinase
MASNPTIQLRDPRGLNMATYLAIGVMFVIGVRGLTGWDLQAAALGLCLMFALLHGLVFHGSRAEQYPTFYFAAQTGLVIGLLALRSEESGAFGFLFFILCVQAVLVLPGRSAAVWITLYGVIVCVHALLTLGLWNGLLNTMFNAAAFFLFGVFGQTLRQSELARRENQRLLEELRTAQRRLQELAITEERNRLAREMHDSVKQQVFAAIMQLGAARAVIDHDVPSAKSHLMEAEQLAGQARNELTSLINELRPVALEGKGLAAALRTYVADWSRQSNITADVRAQAERPMPPAVEQALMRIAQEALANVARHSQATTVEVGLTSDGDVTILTIADNGRGFDLETTQKGVGLDSMRERVEALSGRLHVESTPGAGTRITARCEESDD